jgi:hypothetical protein
MLIVYWTARVALYALFLFVPPLGTTHTRVTPLTPLTPTPRPHINEAPAAFFVYRLAKSYVKDLRRFLVSGPRKQQGFVCVLLHLVAKGGSGVCCGFCSVLCVVALWGRRRFAWGTSPARTRAHTQMHLAHNRAHVRLGLFPAGAEKGEEQGRGGRTRGWAHARARAQCAMCDWVKGCCCCKCCIGKREVYQATVPS